MSAETPRLLVVAPFGPRHDSPHGGRVLAQLLDSLLERHEVGVVHLDRGGEAPMDAELVARCAFVRPVPARRERLAGPRWRYRLSLLESGLARRPTAVTAVHSFRLAQAVRSATAAWRPDVVQIEGDVVAYCIPYLEECSARTMLVIHDPGLPSAQELVWATGGRQRLAHRLDTRLWGRYWRRMLPQFDAVVTLTGQDAQAVRTAVPGVTPVEIPLGIEIPPAPLDPGGAGAPSVAFVGGYGHTPNIDATLRLMGSIMPQARARVPGVKLLIIGDNPSDAMRAAAGDDDEITGHVAEVAPYLDRASLVALPIRLGGGMRIKLLEALAAGKAVVASPVAVAGLELPEPPVLRIADSDEEFGLAITELLRNDAARAELGQSARRWALANLGWSSRQARYEEVYLNLKRNSDPTDADTRR